MDIFNVNTQYLITFLLLVLLSLTAVIIYTTYYNSNYYSLQWSYAICWAGVLCYFAAIILQIIHIDLSGKEDSRQNVKYTL